MCIKFTSASRLYWFGNRMNNRMVLWITQNQKFTSSGIYSTQNIKRLFYTRISERISYFSTSRSRVRSFTFLEPSPWTKILFSASLLLTDILFKIISLYRFKNFVKCNIRNKNIELAELSMNMYITTDALTLFAFKSPSCVKKQHKK